MMKVRFIIFCSLLVVAFSCHAPADDPPRSGKPIDFTREVLPIFEKSCHRCHGSEKQKGGLRLDRKKDALAGGDSGPVLIPGKSQESLLYLYVAELEPGKRMPPQGDKLTAAQLSTIKQWIDQGATWPDSATTAKEETWWSLKPLHRPAVPTFAGAEASWIKTPIDAFILSKLIEKGLKPAPQADRRTLIRRVTFDLIGLPPTYDEVQSFMADPDPLAYEKLVDRLLASPHYGERWARHWLDVVHYGETHGYDKDKPRPHAWPYRDYVIRAFNQDKPYGRFVQEQLAGDALFPGTRDGIEALGFIAAGPWDFIGHAELPETKIDGKIARHLDRDDMVANTMSTFQSLTVHCAQCHNHKFDPISSEDYYSLQAVFSALDRADKPYDLDPAIAAKRTILLQEEALSKTKHRELVEKIHALAGPRLKELDGQLEKAKRAGKDQPQQFGYHSAIESSPDRVKWVQVDLGQSVDLSSIEIKGCYDDFNNIGAGFGFPVKFKIEVSDDPAFKNNVHMVVDQTSKPFPNPGTDPLRFSVRTSARYVRFTATTLALRQNDYILALAELKALDAQGKNWAKDAAVTALDSIEAPPRWGKKNLVDEIEPGAGSKELLAELRKEREELLKKQVSKELQQQEGEAGKKVERCKAALAVLPKPLLIYAGTIHSGSGTFLGTGGSGGKPRPIHVLQRGNIQKPGKEIGPGAISSLQHLPARFALSASEPEGKRRAALAHWITHPGNPLTWRSIVNRLWHYHMGRGLVDTPNDFGKMGQLPTHPELLDWLAVEFCDQGQSLKKLHRLIVTSAVYQQSSTANSPSATRALQVDANNAYYWRMNRRKLEAEVVRDSILSVCGILDLTMGGPSFQDYVIDKPEHSPHYEYHRHDSDDPKTHRRSIYRSIVRSQQHPWMASLDCADPSLSVDKRNQTLSPLQALALLNNDLVLVMAKHLRQRVSSERSLEDQVRKAFRLVVQRNPVSEELTKLVELAKVHGLQNTCRVLLNLSEFVFVD